MGAEFMPNEAAPAPAPLVLGLQPAALIDHVARVDWSLLDRVPGERGGSIPVAMEELEQILREVKTQILSSPHPVKAMAGGSVANTVRGLSAGFGISTGIVGAYGDDDQGQQFVYNMGFSGVDFSRMRKKKGLTGQCVCLVDALGNRTMRPCLSCAVKIQADELTKEDFKGAKVDLPKLNYFLDQNFPILYCKLDIEEHFLENSSWLTLGLACSSHLSPLGFLFHLICLVLQWLIMRYGVFHLEVIQAAIRIAKQEGLFVSLDLASFEMVRNFRAPLLELLDSGNIDLCFANEDEAAALLSSEERAEPEAALEFLATRCKWAVVTLGRNGCMARHGKVIVRATAVGEVKATDSTGAGDLFASGFLYGLIKGLSLEDCCKVGSCSGGSVIRSLGGEVTPENWKWMYKQMQIQGLPLPNIRN